MKLLIILILIYSILDYPLYLTWGRYDKENYRFFQGLLVGIGCHLLYNNNLIWYNQIPVYEWIFLIWLGVPDLIYEICDLIIGIEDRYFFRNFFDYDISWLKFTPYYLIMRKDLNPLIVTVQSFMGIIIVVIISLINTNNVILF